ncbi:WRKY transcription factor 44 isoform X2 [Neltuma alba]|uniref:WRKY transcription factor 44 isoform X2 n=1 Tax=Neltuma alba TaxID=207710 RepID=UPI0010A2F0AE|nr:WRKY transcription factor 44 isoform X2 [Prosopis alba]
MDVKEAERVVVAKPVASRPSCPPLRSFSELLAGAINASPSPESSQATVSAIRPKTVRFKPAVNRPPPAGFISSEASPSYKSHKSDTNQTVVYKPTAKFVSKATVSLLANMGNYSTTHSQQLQHPNQEKPRTNLSSINHQNNNTPGAESNLAIECFKVVQQAPEEDQKTSPSTSNGGDRPCYDGYNWRKYGQKQVKGSEYPRSYYKCTHPNCPVKKKVERSFDGQIAEIVYKGEHNHSKPQPPKRNSAGAQGSGIVSDGLGQDTNYNKHLWGNPNSEKNENRIENQSESGYLVKAGGSPVNSYAQSEECEEGSKGNEVAEDEPKSKRRKNENQSNEVAVAEEGLVEPQVVVQSSTDSEVLGDGFRWRKYGQKVVKGNPHPRSYYRCTNIKCSARKHVEKSIDDPKAFITTYEGKHNHEMPRKTVGAVASDKVKP